MQIIETRVLRGPNVYAMHPCYLGVVELGELAEARLPAAPAFDLPADTHVAEGMAFLLAWLQRQGHFETLGPIRT